MDYFVGHLVGDFLAQNDYMAQGKKRSTPICALHVLLYSVAVWSLTLWPWWAILITAAAHFAQDRSKFIDWFFRVTGKEKFGQAPMAPWSVIVVDNSFHLVQLWITAELVKIWG